MADTDLNDPDLRARAVQAAQGRAPFDLIIGNVRLLDMVTHRIRHVSIGIVGGLIARIGPPDLATEATAETCYDGAGQFALPGLIDTHMHIESSMVTPATYAAAVVPMGVTTVVWDPHEFANACGMVGMEYATEAVRDLPLRVLTLAPTCVPSAPGYERAGADFGPKDIAALLAREDIHGAAELMTMRPLLAGSPRVKGIVQATLASGKRLCGHARGLEGAALDAFVAAGVETDHELTSGQDLLARLEAGLTVEIRGSHGHLLPDFVQVLLDLGQLPQTVTLCTDDVFPDDLLGTGGLAHVVRRLISLGLPPAWAFQAATFNAAHRIGRPDLGLIAPGRRADIGLYPDLACVRARQVFVDGRLLADAGTLLTPTNGAEVPQTLRKSVDMRTLRAADFEIAADGQRARLATLCKPRFPVWGARTLPVEQGHVAVPPDMVRMSVIHRYGAGTPPRVALLEDWGKWRGAFATTVSHDSHNLTVFGSDPADMAQAANAVRAMDGGLAVVQGGAVLATLALPVAGLVSAEPLASIAAGFAEIREAMNEVVDWAPPYLVFKALFGASLVCNPGPRLSDVGLVDVFEERILESSVLADDGMQRASSSRDE